MVRIPSLDRKLFRDLWLIKGQALAIALVIGAGVAMYVLLLSTFDSLYLTRSTYYERFRFGHVFASCKRAPLRLEERISNIPGVAKAETRVIVEVTLDVEGLSEPAIGRLISIPAVQRSILCDLFMRKGRYIEAGHADEVIASETFAQAHGLEPGDKVAAVINGRRRELTIVGLALTPEYIYQIRPGEMIPDEKRFGVFWMERRALATAFQMDGGFNDVVLTLMRGASEDEVISRLDSLLKPYGGLGAIPRRLQVSHWYLDSELNGLRSFGTVIPIIFLLVAAFLLNVVLSRIVQIQREQIAAIKALGYSNTAVALHYIKWSLLVSALGCAAGVGVGAWLGRNMTEMYTIFFHFPILQYYIAPKVVIQAVSISFVAAVLGAISSVRRAVKLPPAEAMRPEAPARYSESFVEKTGLKRFITQPTRIIFRTLQRHPGRAGLSILGISMGCALLIVGTFSIDSVEILTDIQFNMAQRYDVMVTFTEPVSSRALYEVQRLPGVLDSESFRSVAARLRHGHRSRQTAVTGLPARARLNRIIDASLKYVDLPPKGLVLSAKLAEILNVRVGDRVTIEVLEGKRPVRQAIVSKLVDDFMGTNAYMEIGALHQLMREGQSLSGAFLLVDDNDVETLYHKLKNTPSVAGVLLKKAAIESFESTWAEMVAQIRIINMMFAAVIAFGVVYNSARISLAERSRELATLRVIGFTRAEISYILLGELAIITLIAIPVGLIIGYAMAAMTVEFYNTEVWRMPLVVSSRTYAFAAITVLVATAVSSLIVRHKLDRLDLVEVLKTKE